MLNDKTVLITGGTGSFGQKLTEVVLRRYTPKRLIVFSRDELKQADMRQRFSRREHPCLRYFTGDVRDRDRLDRAFDGVDVVVHAAALKHVPNAEYNPLETIKTNVLGTANVIDAAINCEVTRVITLSTDKAASPTSLYGASKLCADKLFVAANSYSGTHPTRFSVVRYGNIVGSRGSVVLRFLEKRHTGKLQVTDERMTRFWITLEQCAEFVLASLERMEGGEIFIPKIPSMRIVDVARAIAPECELEFVGIRPGEKLHEVLITEDDARTTMEYEESFVILPSFHDWAPTAYRTCNGGKPCAEGFRYSSDANTAWLTPADLQRMMSLG